MLVRSAAGTMFAPTRTKSFSDCPPPPARNDIRFAKLISLIVTGLHTSRMSATGRNQPSFLPPPPLHSPRKCVTPLRERKGKALARGYFPITLHTFDTIKRDAAHHAPPLTPNRPHRHTPTTPATADHLRAALAHTPAPGHPAPRHTDPGPGGAP